MKIVHNNEKEQSQNVTNGNAEEKQSKPRYFEKITKFESESASMHSIYGTPFNIFREEKTYILTLGKLELDRDTNETKLLGRWKKPNWNQILKLNLAVIEYEKITTTKNEENE